MTRACAQTIGPRIRISRHDGASARCSVSNRPDPPSVSCPFTPPSTTHSTSSAISPPAARFASSETKRSGRGEPPPRPEHELGLANCAGPNSVHVTAPPGTLPYGKVELAAASDEWLHRTQNSEVRIPSGAPNSPLQQNKTG